MTIERRRHALDGPFWVPCFFLALVLVILFGIFGCSAKLGPGEYGWASWDVCGYEGGVAASVTVMEIGARLGCTNPEATDPAEPEPAP